MQSLAGGIMAAVVLTGSASAQDAMRYYTFESRDAVVTCGQGHVADRPTRTIYQRGRGWVEQDLRPTDAVWVSSGCAGYIEHQGRPVSGEDVRDRMNAILNPPPPDSFETIMGRITENLCKQDPERPDCD